jgi:predicted nuclease of predicted toxin-antitoxin system
MGTLWSELGPLAEHVSGRPRVYADANVPAGLLRHMRHTLGWDVLAVIEQPDLRRAPDREHFRLARQLRRTLVTLDHDYLDAHRFPPAESTGVLVLEAPTPEAFERLLSAADETLFHRGAVPLPLEHQTRLLIPEPEA